MSIRQRVGALFTAVLVVVVGVVAASSPAHASTYGPYKLVHNASGLCLEVPNSSNTPGEQLKIVTCNTASNQKFMLVDSGFWQFDYYYQPYYNVSLCLQPGAPSLNNSTIVTWGCNGTDAQIWFSLDEVTHILNYGGQKCLTVDQYFNGAYVRQNSNCSTANAEWSFL